MGGQKQRRAVAMSVAGIPHSHAVGVPQSGYWYFVLKFCYLCGHACYALQTAFWEKDSKCGTEVYNLPTCANLTRHCQSPRTCYNPQTFPFKGYYSDCHASRVPVQRPSLNFDRPNQIDRTPANTSIAHPRNFAINFATFSAHCRSFCFLLYRISGTHLNFFNCHKFILIQREIYEWQIEFENWVIFLFFNSIDITKIFAFRI